MDIHKLKAISLLHNMGLNVPVLYHWFIPLNIKHQVSEWDRLREELKYKKVKRVSIRTERHRSPNQWHCPHFPNVTLGRANKLIPVLLDQGFVVMVFQAINPDKCEVKGNLAFPKDKHTVVAEYSMGPGTVRDAEKDQKKTQLILGFDSPFPKELEAVFQSLGKLKVDDIMDYIFEFSIYQDPVGIKPDRLIFWERRPWK